jgi:endonuclease G, mitochondrial
MKKYLILLILLASNICAEASDRILELNYEGFTVWHDCDKRGAVKFRYNAQHDTGSFNRLSSFYLDRNVPTECQQTSTKAYGLGYDRGHLVAANHMDYSATAIKQSNFMVNVLPQAATMNRGHGS